MSDMITVTIDGIECTCEKGEYIYDVAKRNGIKIPTLCRHDAFEDHRACCRICIVEVEQRGRTKVVTSCVYPIDGECEIRTNSERIQEERAVLYVLLGHRVPCCAVPRRRWQRRTTSLRSSASAASAARTYARRVPSSTRRPTRPARFGTAISSFCTVRNAARLWARPSQCAMQSAPTANCRPSAMRAARRGSQTR